MIGKQAVREILKYNNRRLIELADDEPSGYRSGQMAAYRDNRRMAREYIQEMEQSAEAAKAAIES
jgi:hypothetical protein